MQLNNKIEQGEVIKILPFNEAKVKIKRHSQCVGCSQHSLCYPFGENEMVITAKNNINAREGDKVEIKFSIVKRYRAIIILYIIPILSFIGGAVFGSIINPFHNKDVSASLVGILSLIFSFIGIYVYNRWLVRNKPSLVPIIIRKI